MLRSKVKVRPWVLLAAVPVAIALVYVVYISRNKPVYNLEALLRQFPQQAAGSRYAAIYANLTADEINQKLNQLAEADLRPLNPQADGAFTLAFTSNLDWQISTESSNPPLLFRAIKSNWRFEGMREVIYRESDYNVLQTSRGSVFVFERSRYWLLAASSASSTESLPAILKILN